MSSLDRELGRQLHAQKRALVILNDPCQNPTGYSMTDDEWRAVVERVHARAAEGPVTLLVDCAYFLFGAGARDPRAFLRHLRPLLQAEPRANVLFAWSASKSFTHYGLRVGALVACVGDPGERAAIQSALSYSCRGTWSNQRGGLAAITRLLSDPEMARTCAAERGELQALLGARVDAFNRHARERGLRYPRYEGGFFVTVFHDAAREKAEAMRAQGVPVVPQVRQARQAAQALRVALVLGGGEGRRRLVGCAGVGRSLRDRCRQAASCPPSSRAPRARRSRRWPPPEEISGIVLRSRRLHQLLRSRRRG